MRRIPMNSARRTRQMNHWPVRDVGRAGRVPSLMPEAPMA